MVQIAASALSIGCLVLSFAPPFGVFIAALIVLGFGSGMYDTVITTLMAHDDDSPALMSYMYAMFGLGATLSPLIIGTLVDHDIPWKVGTARKRSQRARPTPLMCAWSGVFEQRYYYVPLGLSVLLLIAGRIVFAGCQSIHHASIPILSSVLADTRDSPRLWTQTSPRLTRRRPCPIHRVRG